MGHLNGGGTLMTAFSPVTEPLVVDLGRYEVRLGGRVIKLERIPMELLILLVENWDQVVTREQIVQRLWGCDVFTDTENGINTAVRKIRAAINDDPEHARYIQTTVRRGYRFIGPVALIPSEADIARLMSEASGQ
jgi:DNA-binding winged helix-turn-helix (wHTH) protein